MAKTPRSSQSKVADAEIKTLRSRGFSDDEQSQIVTDLLALKKSQIGDFLVQVKLGKSGTKEEIRERIENALTDKSLALGRIVQFLDEVIPWGKQHVYMYRGPKTPIADWRKLDWLAKLIEKNGVAKFLNARLSLVLPESMSIVSILHDERRLRITAIKKREWWERDEDYDDTGVTEEGNDVELRAFVHRVTRSLVAFEWDLVSNTAFLQISQLPTGSEYDDVANEFFDLVSGWLARAFFSTVDLRPAIKKLHELEEAKKAETRSHGINYRTLAGRRFEGRSASPSDSLFGEAAIDSAMSVIRKAGVGHLGNFYWLPGTNGAATKNKLDCEVHVIVVGAEHRVNFPTPNTEESVRYVLSRIRSHCRRS